MITRLSIICRSVNLQFCTMLALAVSVCALLSACGDTVEESPVERTGFELRIDMNADAFAHINALDDAAALVISIADAGGAPVYNSQEVALYDFDDTHLSHPLSLVPGDYSLTELVVIDASGDALYAAPIEGSPLAHLVADPLAIDFSIAQDDVTTVQVEVVSTEARTPQEFGYASFEIGIVERLDFLVAVFTYNDAMSELEPTSASIVVTNEDDTQLYAGTLAAATNHITVPAGHAEYRVLAEKLGYAPYSQGFGENDLAAHFESSERGPLTIVLDGDGVVVDLMEVQSIATQGAADVESFSIGSDSYLAIANLTNGITSNVSAKIYRWNGAVFAEVQSIATQQVTDLAPFQIGTDHYLGISDYWDGSYHLSAKIMRWNGNQFVPVQSIPTQGNRDMEFFQIGSNYYLAIANYVNDIFSHNVPSKIYRWNGTTFVEIQSMSTQGARDWAHFQIGTEHYLALASDPNGPKINSSKVYRWNGTQLVDIQTIATEDAFSWEHLAIGSEHYLALATHNPSEPSKIYHWNGTQFVQFQTISTDGAADWEHFVIGGQHYLTVANSGNGATHNVASKLFRWNGALFEESVSVPTQGAMHWKYLQIGTQHYLAVANYQNDDTFTINSKVYRLIFD